jgi:hypothetical protein
VLLVPWPNHSLDRRPRRWRWRRPLGAGELGSLVNRRTVGFSIAGIIAASVFALAFAVASRACEGGLDLYFWSGVAALAILVTLPFLMHFGGSLLGSLGWAFGLLLFGIGVWLAGLFAANVRIICRLF